MCLGEYRCFPLGAKENISSNSFLRLLHHVVHLVKAFNCWLNIFQSIIIYDLFKNLIENGNIELYEKNCVFFFFTWSLQGCVHTFFVGKPVWGLEDEALIVRCPQGGGPLDHVEWFNSSTNESISTQKSNGIVVSRDRLKFLPARVAHSGIYACVVRRYCAGIRCEPCACSLLINDRCSSCPCFLSALPLRGMAKCVKWFEPESTPEKTSSLTGDGLLSIPQQGHIYAYTF